MKARHQHDCPDCRLLGTLDYLNDDGSERQVDLYSCTTPIGASLIARYSGEPSDYSSMPTNVLADALHVAEPGLVAAYSLWMENNRKEQDEHHDGRGSPVAGG